MSVFAGNHQKGCQHILSTPQTFSCSRSISPTGLLFNSLNDFIHVRAVHTLCVMLSSKSFSDDVSLRAPPGANWPVSHCIYMSDSYTLNHKLSPTALHDEIRVSLHDWKKGAFRTMQTVHLVTTCFVFSSSHIQTHTWENNFVNGSTVWAKASCFFHQ